jgi:predicted Zn finger-like uncharacterized protein
MTTADSTYAVECPHCKARFAASGSFVGRRAKCASCGQDFVIPPPPAAAPPSFTPIEETVAAKPEYVSVDCRVCGTRLTGRLEHVGRKIKCPDCGAATLLPPPPPPKAKNIPAALEGEQYELWDPDDQPLPSEIKANQPNYISFLCKVCGTLLQANEIQVGQFMTCPDCRTHQAIPAQPRRSAPRSVLTPDSETPIIDPTSIPGDLPTRAPSEHRMLHEQQQELAYARAKEKAERTGKPMEIDVRGRSVLPRWPLLSGFAPFVFTLEVFARWLSMSVAFSIPAFFLLAAIAVAMMGGMAAIGAMCIFACGAVLMMLAVAFISGTMLQIITESAVGESKLETWPTFSDWFGAFLLFIVSGMLSALPGSALGSIPALDGFEGARALVVIAGLVIVWPIVILSQLEIDSVFGVLSIKVLGSLARRPFSWALFYVETFALLAVCGVATYVFNERPFLALIFVPPVYIAALILIARLLGRLAWYLSESITVDVPEEEPRPAFKNYNPPRPSKRTN